MDLFTIKKCSNCPNRLVDLESLETELRQVLHRHDFNIRLKSRVNPNRSRHHQMFHIALAGCPNCCSQPQIKDFGAIGQALPKVGNGCNSCGACSLVCPESAISIGDTGAFIDRQACLNCGLCSRACPSDIISNSRRGYRILIGGKLGRHPRLATELIPWANQQQTAAALGLCVDLFLDQGRPGERFGQLLERVSLTVPDVQLLNKPAG